MKLKIVCKNCGQRYSLGLELAGKKVRCRKCGEKFRVPTNIAPSEPELRSSPQSRTKKPRERPETTTTSDARTRRDSAEVRSDESPRRTTPRPDPPTISPPPSTTTPRPDPAIPDILPRGGSSSRSEETPKSRPKNRDSGQPAKKPITLGQFKIPLLAVVAFAGSFLIIVLGLQIFRFSSTHREGSNGDLIGRDPSVIGVGSDPDDQFVDPARAIVRLPDFPDLVPSRLLEPGVEFSEITLQPSQDFRNDPPPGHQGTLWYYQPQGDHEAGSLPCVLIAPGGTSLLTGIGLAPGDRPEHLPYVRRGFAVLGYDLDGAVEDGDSNSNSDRDLAQGIQEFLDARAGLTNLRIAIEYLKAKVPQVDPSRLYTAGHSSAGTLSLLAASKEPSIAGAIAFMPAVDIEKTLESDGGDRMDVIKQLRSQVSGLEALYTTYSPISNESKIRCPVFLCTAPVDSIDAAQEVIDAAKRLRKLDVITWLETVPRGDNDQPMLNPEIDRAIDWLVAQGARPNLPELAIMGGQPSGDSVERVPGMAADAGPNPTGPASVPLALRYNSQRLIEIPPNPSAARGQSFREIGPEGGLLVGLRVRYTDDASDKAKIGSIQPIFQVGSRYIGGGVYGARSSIGQTTVIADPGDAIVALEVRTDVNIDAIQISFMKVEATRLDPSRSSISEWIGDAQGGRPLTFSTRGYIPVGLTGLANSDGVQSIGLVIAQ